VGVWWIKDGLLFGLFLVLVGVTLRASWRGERRSVVL
jgi:hypothetical protein